MPDRRMNGLWVLLTIIFSLMLATSVKGDGAGHITPPHGLAFGGIPYGSVSGQVSDYFKDRPPLNAYPSSYEAYHSKPYYSSDQIPALNDNQLLNLD